MKTNLFLKVMFVLLMASISCNIFANNSPQNAQQVTPLSQSYMTYSDDGLSIKYPNDFIPAVNKRTIPEQNSLTGKETIINFTSPDKITRIRFEVVEDPTAHIEHPELYPPSDNILRLSAASAMGSPGFTKSQENEAAAKQAYENAIISPISGHQAISYKVHYKDENYGGDIYMRGAVIITEKRDVTIYIIGFLGKSPNGNVNSTNIDKLWENIINSVSISY